MTYQWSHIASSNDINREIGQSLPAQISMRNINFPISFNAFLVGISDFAYTDDLYQWKIITQFNSASTTHSNFLMHSFNSAAESVYGVRYIVIGI